MTLLPRLVLRLLLASTCYHHHQTTTIAFYLPGIKPNTYHKGDEIPIQVSPITSMQTKIPINYDHLPVCKTSHEGSKKKNIGNILTGTTPNQKIKIPLHYNLNVLRNIQCQVACQITLENENQVMNLGKYIRYGYHNNWSIDDHLPSVDIGSKDPGYEGLQQTHFPGGGFPIGFVDTSSGRSRKAYVYNHLNILIEYHRPVGEDDDDGDIGYRIVGFKVEPLSIRHKFLDGYKWDSVNNSTEGYQKQLETCMPEHYQKVSDKNRMFLSVRKRIQEKQKVEIGADIVYTYNVLWKERKDVAWSTRWDIFLEQDTTLLKYSGEGDKIHWYAILNSIVLVIVLSWMVLTILMRNLKRDIVKYKAIGGASTNNKIDIEKERHCSIDNIILAPLVSAVSIMNGEGSEKNIDIFTDDNNQDGENESGWKALHNDIFRPPQGRFSKILYCAFIGSGVQLGITLVFMIVFSAIGFVNPEQRGLIMMTVLGIYAIFGTAGGYVSATLHQSFLQHSEDEVNHDKNWNMCVFMTATFFPGLSFSLLVLLNTMLSFYDSSSVIPFMEMVLFMSLWFGISIPLVYIGSFVAHYRSGKFNDGDTIYPCKTSNTERSIPKPSSLIMNPILQMILGGAIPYSVLYIEFYYVLTSLWYDQYYYLFAFTLVVYILACLVCAGVSILACYYQLLYNENYKWWWFSFAITGSTSLYMFLFGAAYWFCVVADTSGENDSSNQWMITYLLYFGYLFLFCMMMFLIMGTVGSLSCLWFIVTIYGAIKVD